MITKRFLLDRAREASTWRGVVMLAAAGGVKMTPDQMESIIAIGMAIAGAIGVFFPDSTK